MPSILRRPFLAILIGFLAGLGPAHAASLTEAGKALAALGAVRATQPDGGERELVAGSPVYGGDVVATGPGAAVQLRYTDGTLVSLSGNSALRIDDYLYPYPERGFFSLLKGGLRSLSGLIGKLHHDDYRMDTPVATIGIRGTDYQLRVCQGDCPPGFPDGLYLHVFDGSIVASNDAGEFALHAGESAYIPDRRSPLERRGDDPELLLSMQPWHGAGARGHWRNDGMPVQGISLEFHAADLVRCNR